MGGVGLLDPIFLLFMDEALDERLRQLTSSDPSLGYRKLHELLKEEEEFKDVSQKRVQNALKRVRQDADAMPPSDNATAKNAAPRTAGPGENIWTAASDGDAARVEELMECDGFTPTSPDENGYTPIHAAASWGRVELLRMLLQRDASSANVQDEDGDTPLHHVAGASELEPDEIRAVVELLLSHGADPKLLNKEGKTCLEACGEKVLEAEEDEEPPTEDVDINLEFIKVLADHGHKIE